MSTAAGAMAAASVLPPVAAGAAGVATTGGVAAAVGADAFEGLLEDTDGVGVPGKEPGLSVDATAQAADASSLAPELPPPPALPPGAPAAPPPMDDAATTAVLNALALRVAIEGRASPGPVAAGRLDGLGLIQVGSHVAALDATTGKAPDASVAAVQSVGLALSAQAALATLARPVVDLAGPKGSAGPLALDLAAGAPADGAQDALDALLSTLDALLPPAAAKATAAASQTPAPTPSSTASGVSLPAIMPAGALPNAPTAADAADPLSLAATALADAGVVDAAADAGATTPSTTQGVPAASVAFNTSPMPPGAATTGTARFDAGQSPIPVPFDHARWGDELATRLAGLAREQVTEAEIRVTPDELGPIEVKLRFDGERVHAQFGAISPEAREALTANLHRLREMLAGEGLDLGQAFVGHQGQDPTRRFDGSAARSGRSAGEDDEAALPETRGNAAVRRGLLDEFA